MDLLSFLPVTPVLCLLSCTVRKGYQVQPRSTTQFLADQAEASRVATSRSVHFFVEALVDTLVNTACDIAAPRHGVSRKQVLLFEFTLNDPFPATRDRFRNSRLGDSLPATVWDREELAWLGCGKAQWGTVTLSKCE